MEILFENRYVRNKDLAKEMYRYLIFQRRVMVVSYVFILLALLINLAAILVYKIYNWEIIILALLLLLFQAFRYYFGVKSFARRDQEAFGKELEVQTIVTADHFECTASNGAVTQVTFDKIKRAVRTKNLILLQTQARLLYILRGDAFTKGTKEEFVAFLRSKGIKVS